MKYFYFFLLFSFLLPSSSNSAQAVPPFLYLLVTKEQWKSVAPHSPDSNHFLSGTNSDYIIPSYDGAYEWCCNLKRLKAKPKFQSPQESEKYNSSVIFLTLEQLQIYRPLFEKLCLNQSVVLECSTSERSLPGILSIHQLQGGKENFFHYQDTSHPGAFPLAAVKKIFCRSEEPNLFDVKLITEALTTPDKKKSSQPVVAHELATHVERTLLTDVFGDKERRE